MQNFQQQLTTTIMFSCFHCMQPTIWHTNISQFMGRLTWELLHKVLISKSIRCNGNIEDLCRDLYGFKLPITFIAHMCVLPNWLKSHFTVSVFYVDFFTMNVSMTTAGNYVGHVKKTSIINRYIIKITSGWHRYSFTLDFISKLKCVFSRRQFN